MTSIHDGVSCNSCRKNNFRGLRYKCLICYDYDLCSNCYESGVPLSQHTVNHPMQCIIAREDYDLFYAGEAINPEQHLSLTCPLCGGLGFTESSLLEHVNSEHANSDNDESPAGVVCPICGVETNQLIYDFATHLTMEHRTPRDPIEQVTIRGRGGRCHPPRTTGPRGRRSQPHYGGASSSPSNRDSTDPLVEILAQISGVRRVCGGSYRESPASQLHQLQMHLQSSSSFLPRTSNDREVRIMRRTFQSMNNQLNSSSTSTTSAGANTIPSNGAYSNSSNSHYCSTQPFALLDQSSLGTGMMASNTVTAGIPGGLSTNESQPNTMANQMSQESSNLSSQFLLSKCMKPTLTEAEQQEREVLKADRSLFVQELLLQVGLLENNK